MHQIMHPSCDKPGAGRLSKNVFANLTVPPRVEGAAVQGLQPRHRNIEVLTVYIHFS